MPTPPRLLGTPLMSVWRAEDYGADPENFCAVQHPRTGFVYVGNNAGVLEFDGARWRLTPSPTGSEVGALTVDARGRIWGLSGATIFRLEPDARGQWQARSLNDRLPTPAGPARFLSWCVSTTDGVWFADEQRLFCFPADDSAARAWTVAERPVVAIRLWTLGDECYVMTGGNLTYRVRKGGLERVPGLNTTIWAGRREADGNWRLLTPYTTERWEGNRLTTLGRLPAGDGAYRAALLADGRAVFGTGRSGIVVCDPTGQVVQKIDREQGLPANQVVDVMEDREGGVWAVTRNGVARLQFDSPYAVHGPAQGVDGTIHSLARHGGRLFAGGTEGAFERGPSGRFVPVPEISTAVREVVAHDDRVYFLSTRLRSLRPDIDRVADMLENRNYFGLVPMPEQPGRFAHGSNEGVRWARFVDGRWKSEGPLAATRGRANVLLEWPSGVVWAAHAGAAWRIDFRGGLNAGAPARRFGPAEGMAAAPVAMFPLGDSLAALAGGVLVRFDERAGRFVAETRIEGFDTLAESGAESVRLGVVHVSADGTIWIQGEPPRRALARLVPSGVERWRVELLPGEPLSRLKTTTLFHEAEANTLWIGGAGALVSYDLSWHATRPAAAPAARVRRVESPSGEVIFGGAATLAKTARLDSRQVALRVHFAAPAFAPDHRGVTHIEYRTKLDGLDREWSAWSRETARDFTNLPWRELTFRVQARAPAGRVGPEATWAFTIAPPWWAARWAWPGYGVIAIAGIAGTVRLRTRVLRRRAERLERMVAERTRALADSNSRLTNQNAELARLHQLELDEKIAAQFAEEKARLELLRYQLNPHFLLNAFTTLRSLVHSSPDVAGRTVDRLAEFCRLALTRHEDNGATVDDELTLIESYLDTEKTRWRDDLQVELRIDPLARSMPLPPFLLQPLVENAIKYGDRTSPGILRIRVRIARTLDGLTIEIANTGEWVGAHSPHRAGSTGIGLENLRQRLRRKFPRTHELVINTGGGWVAMTLILKYPADERTSDAHSDYRRRAGRPG